MSRRQRRPLSEKARFFTAVAAGITTQFAFACVPVQAASNQLCANPSTGASFAAKSATSLGFEQERLNQAIKFAASKNTTSIRVYRHGCLAAKSSQDDLFARIPFPLASGSKGVTALAVGRAATIGMLNIDDPIGKYFPEADQAHAAITIRQLLNQTSGLRFSWGSDIAGNLTNSVGQVLSLPFIATPGTKFEYAQTTVGLLTEIVKRATGIEFQQFVQQQLFGQLGIKRNRWVWLRDRGGTTIASGGLAMRPEDQARLGQLLAQNGLWNGQRILSSTFLEQATQGTVANPGYGFLIWVNSGERYVSGSLPTARTINQRLLPGSPTDAYSTMGAFGQLITVIPSLDMVIVRNGLFGYLNPNDFSESIAAEFNKDLKQTVRLISRSVNDRPLWPDADPYTSPTDSAQPINLKDFQSVVDLQLVFGTVFGFGQGSIQNCNLVVCRNRGPISDLFSFGGDSLWQIGNALIGIFGLTRQASAFKSAKQLSWS